MLSAELQGISGEKCNYILAADDRQHLHVIHQGEVVMTVKTPTVVTAVSQAIVIAPDEGLIGFLWLIFQVLQNI